MAEYLPESVGRAESVGIGRGDFILVNDRNRETPKSKYDKANAPREGCDRMGYGAA